MPPYGTIIPERLRTVTRQRVIEHEQHSADTAAAAVELPKTQAKSVRNAQCLCAVSTEVVEADSASNAIDDCVLAACDFRTHIDFFARYTSSILPFRCRRLKATVGAGDVVRHSTIQNRSVWLPPRTPRGASLATPLRHLAPIMLTRAPTSMERGPKGRAGTRRLLGFDLRRHDDGSQGCSNNPGGQKTLYQRA